MSELVDRSPGRRRNWLRLRAEGDELRHLAESPSGRVLLAAVIGVAVLTLAGLAALFRTAGTRRRSRSRVRCPARS